jgi:hypothetical protein
VEAEEKLNFRAFFFKVVTEPPHKKTILIIQDIFVVMREIHVINLYLAVK